MPYHESMSLSPRALDVGGRGMNWSEFVWLSRSLRARIPDDLRLAVAAVALRGGEGDSEVSGDKDTRATSRDKASL